MILAPWGSKLPLVLRQGVTQHECGLCYQKEVCTMRDLYKVSNAISFSFPGDLHALGLPAARPISTSNFEHICSYLRRFVLPRAVTYFPIPLRAAMNFASSNSNRTKLMMNYYLLVILLATAVHAQRSVWVVFDFTVRFSVSLH